MSPFSGAVDDLPMVAEPVELKRLLRQGVLDRPQDWYAREEGSEPLSDWLWERWAPALTSSGIDCNHLRTVVAGYRQELWLWLMGERTWTHTAEGLTGRIGRRAPASSDRPRR